LPRDGSHQSLSAYRRTLIGFRLRTARSKPQGWHRFVRVLVVNVTYICLIWELIDRSPDDEVSPTVRKVMRFRSITTLCFFGVAAAVALIYPLVGLGICICCLIVYLRPDPPERRGATDLAWVGDAKCGWWKRRRRRRARPDFWGCG